MSTTEAPPSLLHDPHFRRFWAGVTLGQLGAQLGHIALPVVAVQILVASELQLGILNASATAAFLLVGLPAGAWVDRWVKRRVMIRADVVRACAVATIPLLWGLDVLAMWHLYLVAAVIGVATVFFDVAYQSVLPFLVRRDQVSDANGKLEGVVQVARVAGPAAGGLLLRVVSAPFLFLADAVGYAASALFLSTVRDREVPRERGSHGRLGTEIAEGVRFVAGHPLLRRIVLCTAGSNVASTLTFTLMPILVLRILGLEPFLYGLVMGAGARPDVLRARLQHHAGEHASADLPRAAARADERLHPVRRLGRHAALRPGGGRAGPVDRGGPDHLDLDRDRAARRGAGGVLAAVGDAHPPRRARLSRPVGQDRPARSAAQVSVATTPVVGSPRPRW